MIVFYFYFYDELPEVGKIKSAMSKIANKGEALGAPLYDTDSKLADEIGNLCFAMFSLCKKALKSFTVLGNKELRKVRIDDDEEGLSEEAGFLLQGVIRENPLEVFSELVAQSYLIKKPKTITVTDRLYCANVFSRYSCETHPVFFVEKDSKLFLFDKEITDITIKDYLQDYYFGGCEIHLETVNTTLSDSTKNFVEKQKFLHSFFESQDGANQKCQNEYGFMKGAITFLDFLAWKGLWQGNQRNEALKEVSELIDNFKTKLNDLSKELFPMAKNIDLSTLLSISDTIAIFTPKTSSITVTELLTLHADLSRHILESCVAKKYPIRGAVAYGDYSIVNNIMIGPGIDECASWHETGNWIGVHFSPTAQILWNEDGKSRNVITGYKIPLKNGLEAKYCIYWNVDKSDFDALALSTRALLPEISGKYTNTYKFLEDQIWGKEGAEHGKK